MRAVSVLVLVPLAVAAPAVMALAYRVGLHIGRTKTIPWRPIFQLVDHRTRCLGQEPSRVRAELGALLSIPPRAWDEILATRRPLDRRTARNAGGRPG